MRMIHALTLLPMLCLSATAAGTLADATQNPEVVAQRVEQFLARQARAWPGSAQIAVEQPNTARFTSCNELHVFLRGRQQLESRLSVGVRCLSPELWTTYVQASVSIRGAYYVAARSIAADTTITAGDLATRTGDLLRLPPGTATDPRDLVGRIATQRIAAGQPVRARALRSPESIQRGQFVRTVARGAGFVATGSGKALESGAPGAQIQVRTSSGRIISATVIDAHTVQVAL